MSIIAKVLKINFFEKRMGHYLVLSSVIIVVCCLILLFAINDSGKREIVKGIKEGGNMDKVSLNPPVVFTEKGCNGKATAILTFSDLRLIKNSCSQVKGICYYTPEYIEEIRIGKKQYCQIDYPSFPSIVAATPEYRDFFDLRLKEGRFINKIDMLYKRRVCVLGGGGRFLCEEKNLIGKKLITKNMDGEFTIIGVLQKKMPLFTSLPEELAMKSVEVSEGTIVDTISAIKMGRKCEAIGTNESIYIPFTTWQDMMKGQDTSVIEMGGVVFENNTIDRSLYTPSALPCGTFVWLKIDAPFKEKESIEKFIKDKEDERVFGDFFCFPIPANLKEPLDSIRKVLRKKYGEDKFFHFMYYGSLTDELRDQIEDSNKLLGILFISSLLFSCIILSSMMLISVHKRVSEIGVRRAFGARKKDIFWQFIGEGAILYSVGIIIGILVGILISYLVIVKLLSWEFSIPVYGIIISSIFVFLVGILSSLYPAMKAANIPPAIAVKYE